MITTATVNPKGQITIPAQFRESLGINPYSRVSIQQTPLELIVRPIQDFFSLRGSVKSGQLYNKKKARQQFLESLSHKP